MVVRRRRRKINENYLPTRIDEGFKLFLVWRVFNFRHIHRSFDDDVPPANQGDGTGENEKST